MRFLCTVYPLKRIVRWFFAPSCPRLWSSPKNRKFSLVFHIFCTCRNLNSSLSTLEVSFPLWPVFARYCHRGELFCCCLPSHFLNRDVLQRIETLGLWRGVSQRFPHVCTPEDARVHLHRLLQVCKPQIAEVLAPVVLVSFLNRDFVWTPKICETMGNVVPNPNRKKRTRSEPGQ